MITVEYLLPFDTKDGVCKDIKSFKSLLASNSNFILETDKILYKTSSYSFSVEQTDVQNQNCSVFHVTFGVRRTTEKFREMLKVFRKTVGLHLKDRIQIVWDGISFEWSKELYPRIYQIENSMRKLISKFMLNKLGIGWYKSAIPKDVKDSIKGTNYETSHSILYEVDFIQLSNFLFKDYSLRDSTKLPEVLNNIVEDGFDESKKDEILEFIPKNNWDRYFSDLVDLESNQLKKKWESLYDTRIKVAHNKSMNFDDFERAKKLCDELEKTVYEALQNIDIIEIPEDKKESVSLKTIGTINEPTRHFVNQYLDLNERLSSKLKSLSDQFDSFRGIDSALSTILGQTNFNGLGLSNELYVDLSKIDHLKNNIISGDSYLTFENSINPDIFKSAKDGLISALDTASIDLNKLNTNLGYSKPSLIQKEEGTTKFREDDDQ